MTVLLFHRLRYKKPDPLRMSRCRHSRQRVPDSSQSSSVIKQNAVLVIFSRPLLVFILDYAVSIKVETISR